LQQAHAPAVLRRFNRQIQIGFEVSQAGFFQIVRSPAQHVIPLAQRQHVAGHFRAGRVGSAILGMGDHRRAIADGVAGFGVVRKGQEQRPEIIIRQRAVETGEHGVCHRYYLVVGRAIGQPVFLQQRGVDAGQDYIVAGVAVA
jgi:hypothetical protein